MTSSCIERRENRLRNISKEETKKAEKEAIEEKLKRIHAEEKRIEAEKKRIHAEEKRIEAEKKRIEYEKKLIEIHIISKEYVDNQDKNDDQYVRQKILEILKDYDFD